jgi:hypothetical protein
MCYALILSTTSSDDLSSFNGEQIRFDKNVPDRLPFQHLLYANKWYVGSRTGCSCSFRHLYGPEFDFSAPEDWFPEEKSDIEATLTFIRLVRSLVIKGEKVDCIDLREGNQAEHPALMSVDLSQIRDEEFRFFEDHHFDFMLG